MDEATLRSPVENENMLENWKRWVIRKRFASQRLR